MVCKKAALKTYAELTGKHPCWSLFLIKFQGFWLVVNLLKRDSETGACFPVNLVKFCISNTTLRQTALQNPLPNIAKHQEEEI